MTETMRKRRRAVTTTVLGFCIAIFTLTQYSFMWNVSNKQEEQEENMNLLQLQRPLNRLYYVGRFGLGHRLSKLSAAYHLATDVFDLPEIELHWGSCQTREIDVFAFLFGTHTLRLRSVVLAEKDGKDKQILVRNDVAGYYAGQSYKNAQVRIPRHYYDNNKSPWKKKMQLDRILFQDLLHRFTERTPELRQFQHQVGWHTHTVIGLHVRAGNGEQDHFAASGRLVITHNNTTTFVQNVCRLLRKYAAEHIPGPILLFLATDTESVIPVVQQACQDNTTTTFPNIPVVTFPQTRVQAAQGVSYHAWEQGQDCFQGWQSSMMDMALLAHTNVLVAGMRSTFTQILPRALVMNRGERYCEVDEATGRTMTCWDNEDSWLFRNPSGSMTCSLNDNNNNSTTVTPVVHKLLVHLPDVEPNVWIEKAQVFLKDNESSASSSSSFAYGERFDSKYRTPGQTFRKDWTLAP